MDSIITCKSIDSQMVRVATLSQKEKEQARTAGRILGLRQAEFYRRAIIEKAQSVLSSTINESNEASSLREPSREDGASFLSEVKK